MWEWSGRARAGLDGSFGHRWDGDDIENCAIFERDGKPCPVTHLERLDIAIEDNDFLEACRLLDIRPE